MKKLILLVVIYGLLKNHLIALAKMNPESKMSEDINAILIKCPKNRGNSSCEPHLIINIHMNPSVDVTNMEDSWILDQVYDPTKRRVSKIISPYLIVVSRGEPVVMYPLQYEKSIKHEELKGKLPSKNEVKDEKGAASSKTNEPSPSENIKEHPDVKDVKTSERLNPINMKEREEVKDVQGSPSPKTNEPRPAINMKERENVKEVPGSPSGKANEPRPSINMKEREEVKDVQGSPSRKNNEPRPPINTEESEEVEDSPSSKTNDPSPSSNMDEHNEAEDLSSRKNDEPSPSSNKEEQEEVKGLQGSPSVNTNEPRTPINTEEHQDVNDLQGTKEPLTPISKKETEEVQNLQSSPSGNTNEPSINMKESECNNSTRLKRNHGRVYTSQKSLGSNKGYLQKRPLKGKTWTQNDISSLGLVQVMDPSLKKIADRLESPREMQRLNKRISKINNYNEKEKNVLRSKYYNQEPSTKGRNKVNKIASDLKDSTYNTNTWDKQILNMPIDYSDFILQDWMKKHNEGRDYQLKSERHPDSKKEPGFKFDRIDYGDGWKQNAEEIDNYKPNFKTPYNTINENNNIETVDSNSIENDLIPRSKNLKLSAHKKKEYYNFKSRDNSPKDFLNGRKNVQKNFKQPFNSRNNLNDIPRVRQKERYDLYIPSDVPSDLNEYNKAKTAENSIYKGKYLSHEKYPEEIRSDPKNENSIYKGKYLPHENYPEDFRLDPKYENSIYKAKYMPHEKYPVELRSEPKNENSIYKAKYLPHEKYPEEFRSEPKNENSIYKAKYLPHEKYSEEFRSDPKNENSIYKGKYLPHEKYPEDFRSEPKNENSIYKAKYMFHEKYPEEFRLDPKNENSIYKAKYLPHEKYPEDFRSETKNENNIYKSKYLSHEKYPEDFRSEPKNVPNGEEFNEFIFKAPTKSFPGMNDIPYPLEYDQFNFNPDAGSFPGVNDFSLGKTNNKDDNHMGENLQNKYLYKNDKNVDWTYSHSLPFNYNPDNLGPNFGLSYSEFPQRSRKEPFSKYPMDYPVTSLRSGNHKRTRRSSSPRHTVRNRGATRFDQKSENDLNAQKLSNLQKMEENGEVPCDTCGGKNKKKDDKPPSRYCSALADPKSPESKMEEEKLNDVVPCDTCGGKNKKPGGKSLPGSLQSDIRREKAENAQPLTAEDMIPCERCKVHGKVQGNLASQSCGCISNPSVCSCESSKALAKKSEEDLTYSVFNMNSPVPFLTTQLRVFRRRHNTWWRVVPIVTLDSLSGIFANKNMSMVFASRVGTFRQEKSSSFSNHKLIVPESCADQLTKSTGFSALQELQNNIGNSFLVDKLSKDVASRETKNPDEDYLKSIGSLGYFPKSMGALQKCPHKDKHLCLNIRGERVPAFSIKLKIPFRENAFLIANKHVVKIARIITDAMTKDALQISIDVINKGLEPQEYSIYVYNCPLSNSALSTTSVRRLLLPNIGQTVTFLLPFISGSKKNRKFSCDVVVKDYDSKNSNKTHFLKSSELKDGVIAKRSMDIKVLSRCFCVWRCRCHCMEKLETYINYNVCERMSRKSQEDAGLIYNCPPGSERNDICITDTADDDQKETPCNLACKIRCFIIFILILLLTLGVLKAFLGLCIQSIDQWGFETVQPGRYYACSSRTRVFIVNLFFFIIYPFACWCKCFQPKPEDLMAASTDWSCNHEREDGGSSSSENKRSHKKARLHGGQTLSEDLLRAFAPHYENGLFKDDKPDDDESTAFILEVLEESKTSLSKMMSQTTHSSHSQEIVSKCAENSEEERAAEELVDSLKSSQRAFRIMSSPLGGVIEIPENCQYCVKGFFLPTVKGTYEFFSYHPLIQYIGISEENEVKKLPELQYLHTDEFSRTYNNKVEVLQAGDLSVVCPPNVPCINISSLSNLESSFVKLTALLEETPINEGDSES